MYYIIKLWTLNQVKIITDAVLIFTCHNNTEELCFALMMHFAYKPQYYILCYITNEINFLK